jgi:hypothetical protein
MCFFCKHGYMPLSQDDHFKIAKAFVEGLPSNPSPRDSEVILIAQTLKDLVDDRDEYKSILHELGTEIRDAAMEEEISLAVSEKLSSILKDRVGAMAAKYKERELADLMLSLSETRSEGPITPDPRAN